MLLLVGSVGAGKSTFIDHLQEVALPADLISTTLWVRLNMNAAPVSANEIYGWLREEIAKGCIAGYPEVDFDDLSVLKGVFSVEVNRFNKGVGKLYQAEEKVFAVKLAELLEKLTSDLHAKAIALTRYCATERGKLWSWFWIIATSAHATNNS